MNDQIPAYDEKSREETWAFFTSRLADLRRELEGDPDNYHLERWIDFTENYLLNLESPNIGAVIKKLKILWECQLEGGDWDSVHRNRILRDLDRLCS
jgi:hypothetical protein